MILFLVRAIISSIRSNMRQLDQKQQPLFVQNSAGYFFKTNTLSELAAESKESKLQKYAWLITLPNKMDIRTESELIVKNYN